MSNDNISKETKPLTVYGLSKINKTLSSIESSIKTIVGIQIFFLIVFIVLFVISLFYGNKY